jgi:hypothetical protein
MVAKKIKQLEYKHNVFEGGASGHMAHIYDFSDLTLKDIKDIITNLFSGKVEDVTEKLDGMNIQCTMNNNGNVVFIRNKGDLNSATGGMSKDDMAAKWAGRDKVLNTYLNAADIITNVFKKIGKKFFNPNKTTKVVANCECITAGKTNILMYSSAQVYFHNLWIYTFDADKNEWIKSEVTKDGIDTLEKACNKIDGAQLTPRVIIKVTETSNKLLTNYINRIDSIFSAANCNDNSTIDDYKKNRFYKLCNDKYPWIIANETGYLALFNRWFNDDKSTNLRELKKIYKDNIDDFNKLNQKEIVINCTKLLDSFFGSLGNSIISLCDGLINAGVKSKVIDELSGDLDTIVSDIKNSGSTELNDELTVQLNRLAELGNQLNETEGIVFKYGDKLIKATGSFSCVNQILGMRFKM